MKAIGYIRVSTTKQDLSRQKVKLREFCESKDIQLIQLIEDFGISGANSNREGYMELQSRTGAHADVIIVSELSRLSRQEDVTETVYNLQQIINRGLSVIMLDNPDKVYEANKLLDITEILILTIKAWAAAQERLDIKRKNQDGKYALFKSNPYAVVDARIPFGFNQIPNPHGNRPKYILEENPEEVAIIKKIYELVLDGHTLYSIAKYFNERNIKARNYHFTIAYLSRFIHSDIYRGIRTRNKTGPNGEVEVTTVRINPIISEEDFLMAVSKIKVNYTKVSTGKVNLNVFKGILMCRCGRGMNVKDKKPAKGVTKLTYRCNCAETRNSPMYCTVAIDEISYDFTNSIMTNLFKQRMVEIQEYYNNSSDERIENCKEVIKGLEERLKGFSGAKKEIQLQIDSTIDKFLQTDNPAFIKRLGEHQTKLENDLKQLENDFTAIKKQIANEKSKIVHIQKINTSDVWNKIKSIDLKEMTAIFNLYLERIEYLPYNVMKGHYRVTYKSGQIDYIVVNKVRSIPKAFILPKHATINHENGDISFDVKQLTLAPDSVMSFSLMDSRPVETVNIKDFFNSHYTDYCTGIAIDTDYRKAYMERLNEKGLNGRLNRGKTKKAVQ